ncbi:MAG: hypothetical protein EAZ89_18030 [Bacteroidetes bacterium]|nr:MAG: hypothetical protein EAZ89_18030 [Bacteroidota bacterium]
MTGGNGNNTLILFGAFIAFLREKGFRVESDAERRVYDELGRVENHTPAWALRERLAPVFAHDAPGRERFQELFDEFFASKHADLQSAEFRNIPPETSAAQDAQPGGWLELLSRRRFYLIMQALLITAVGYGGFRLMDCYLKTRRIDAAWECMLGGEVRTISALDSLPAAGDSLLGWDTPVPLPTRISNDTLIRQLNDKIPLTLDGPFSEDISDLRASWYQRYGPVLKFLFIFFALSAVIFIGIYRRNRRQYLLKKERALFPPYYWSLPGTRERSPGPERDFEDATRSVRATELAAKQRSGYLVLIEKLSARDHLATLFDQLLGNLAGEAILVDRYFYDQDPRVCWKEKFSDEISLQSLFETFPHHRVVIVGNAEAFFDPVHDQLSAWTEQLLRWEKVALITPRSPLAWSRREKRLSEEFLLLPATIEALEELPHLFSGEVHTPLRVWIEKNQYPPLPSGEAPAEMPAELKQYFDTHYEGRAPVRTEGAGRAHMEWLAACALYPELSWDLTLALGEALETPESPALTAPRSLFKLVSLPWFRQGLIPDEHRDVLIRELEPVRQQLARETIVQALRDNPPPAGSYAADEHRLNLAVQEVQLAPGLRKEWNLMQQVQDFSLNHEIRDTTVLNYLKSLALPGIRFRLPDWLNKILFRQGIPGLGFHSGVTYSFFAVFAILLVATIDPSRFDHVYRIGDEHYFVQKPEDRMRYLTSLGTYYSAKNDFGKAMASYEEALRLRDESGKKEYLLPEFNLICLRWKQGESEDLLQEFARLGDRAADLQRENIGTESALNRLIAASDYNSGLLYLRREDLDRAGEMFRDAVKADSSHVQARLGEAVVYVGKALESEGINRTNKFNLALNRLEEIQTQDSSFFTQYAQVVPTLDSVARIHADKATVARFARILKQGQDSSTIVISESNLTSDAVPRDSFPDQVDYLTDFIEGLAMVRYQGKYGFIDERANLRGIKYEDARPFSENLAAVQSGGQWGYINKDLLTQITFAYEKALDFHGGWATVRVKGKWGVIDTQGEEVIAAQYDNPVEFESPLPGQTPLAAVSRNGSYLYIKTDGTPAFGAQTFQYAENFRGEYARVKRWNQSFYINRAGVCDPGPSQVPCPTEQWSRKLQKSLTGHTGGVDAAVYSPDGSLLVTGSADSTAKIWTADGEIIASLRHDARVRAVALSGNVIATGCEDRMVRLWSRDGKLLRTLADARAGIWSLAFSPNGRYLVAGSADRNLYLYESASGQLLATLRGSAGTLLGVTFDPAGKTIASAGEDGFIRFWNLSGKQTGQIEVRSPVLALAFSPDGKRLVCGSRDGIARLYRVNEGQASLLFVLGQHKDWVCGVAFSPDGEYILTSSYDRTARVWNMQRQVVLDIQQQGTVRSATFSPDGRRLTLASWGKEGSNSVNIYLLRTY